MNLNRYARVRVVFLICLAALSQLDPHVGAAQRDFQPTGKPPKGVADDTRKHVRALAEIACSALNRLDLDALMKVVGAPWYSNDGNDKHRIIATTAELRKHIAREWESPGGRPRADRIVTVDKMMLYEDARATFSPEKREKMEPVIGRNDWVVWLNSRIAGNDGPGGIIYVGLRRGQWKLIGAG